MTIRKMRLTAIVLACSLFCAGATRTKPGTRKGKSTTRAKKKARKPPAPVVSAKARAEASAAVEAGLSRPLDISLHNPAALVPFFEMLYRAQHGQSNEPLHVLHYGDSHTAADEWTGSLRTALQSRFGDGGPGFTLPGRPFVGFRRLDLKSGESSRWVSHGLVGRQSDGVNGLGGVSIQTDRAGESIYLEADCRLLELFYLQQPGGGSVELTENGVTLATIPTAGELAPGFFHAEVAPGPHRFELRTLDRAPVRLFGWVAEKEQGVTYETLGINGAQASIVLGWDEPLWAAHLARRNPSLIILAYGTNEASSRDWNYENYREMFTAIIARFRAASPQATILVVGPPDRYYRSRGRLIRFESTDWIVDAQRDAALAGGCAFWDMRAKMGGKGSMRQWVLAGLAQRDYVHLTAAGYRRLGDTMFRDLMENYDTFAAVRAHAATQESHGEKSENH